MGVIPTGGDRGGQASKIKLTQMCRAAERLIDDIAHSFHKSFIRFN